MTVTAPAQTTLAQYVNDYCDTLTQNFKNHTVSSYERHLSASDTEWSTKYYTQRLENVNNGTANLNRFVAYEGRKYIKIVMQEFGRHETEYRDSTVHAFIDKKTGEVYMPAGYNAPTKTGKYPVRWDLRIIKDREYILNPINCTWSGGYLYDRSTLPTKYV